MILQLCSDMHGIYLANPFLLSLTQDFTRQSLISIYLFIVIYHSASTVQVLSDPESLLDHYVLFISMLCKVNFMITIVQ